MRDILGGKGAGLAEMANLGLPVPPGFTISAKLCIAYLEQGTFPDDLREEVDRQLKQLERASKKRFGDARDPLLVSVRSGAAVSMPGMMETILNLGLNDETVQGLIEGSKNPRFAYDSYRRFVQMYGDVVFDLGKEPFTEVLDEFKRRRKAQRDIDLPADDLKALAREFKSIIKPKTGIPFPEDATVQLWGAIAAVFKSWRTRRAVDYRRVHGIPDDLGTAVNVVAMVYGNMGDDSGTGVAFTRDCSTGEAVLNGDVLTNAQGEDVVSGARTPESISTLKRGKLAKVYRELQRIATKLERHFRDVQDIEFTFEHGKLYLLQTQPAVPGSRRCGLPWKWWRRGSSRRARRCSASHPRTWTSCSIRWSTRGRPSPWWRRVSRPRPGRRRARRYSTRTRRRRWPMRAARSSSSGQKPPPRISTGSSRRRRGSPRGAA